MSDLFDFFTGNRGVPRKKKRTTVKSNLVDEGALEDLTKQAELFRNARNDVPTIDVDGKQKPLDSYDTLFTDTFKSHYTVEDPGVLNPDEILPSLEPARRVEQRYHATQDFQDVRPGSRDDLITSGFATIKAIPFLKQAQTEEMEHLAQDGHKARKDEEKIERAEQKLEELRDQAREMHANQEPIPDDLKQQIDKQVTRKVNARHNLAKTQEKMASTPINQGAAKLIEKAAQEAKKAADTVAALPGIGKGASTERGKKLNADESLKLAQMFADNPRLFQIARTLGRIVRDMRAKRARRMVGGVEEVVDVTLGNDLPDVLPSEMMWRRHPKLRPFWKLRFLEGSLLQRERRGTTEAGRGPVVVVVDESSSMNGQPLTWAKALCMALMAIARKEKRDCAVVSYSSKGQLESWEFPWRAPLDPSNIVEMAGHFFSGMTETRDGISLAQKIIAKDQKMTRADIVVVSDGKDRFEKADEKLKADLAERAIRVQGIQVGGPAASFLTQMCESVASAMDLTGANDATDMVAQNMN